MLRVHVVIGALMPFIFFYLGVLAASHLNFGGGPSPAITQGSQLPRAAQTPKKCLVKCDRGGSLGNWEQT